MKLLTETIIKRRMSFSMVERTETVGFYSQSDLTGNKIAFEVFQIKKSNGFTFPNGVYVEPGEMYPSDNDFGKTAWSYVINANEELAFDKAFLKFKELNNTPMKKIDLQNAQVIEDAVRLLKSEFVDLYQRLGFDKTHLGVSWHSLVISPKGIEFRKKFKGANHMQALSFISDMDAEVKDRLTKGSFEEKTSTGVDINNINKNSMKGEKATRAKELIAQGITDPKELAEKAGISKVYAGRLLEKVKVVPEVLPTPEAEQKPLSVLDKIKQRKKGIAQK